MRRASILFGVVLAAAVTAAGAGASNPRSVTVMTLNIYQGTELEHVLASTPSTFPFAAGTDYATAIANDFPVRAQGLADEIAAAQPALVGLQEVATWRTGANPFAAPTTVSYDYLQILLDALAARGQHYAPVVVRTNWEAHGPAIMPSGTFEAVGLTERTAIIARTDLPTDLLKLSNAQSVDFVHFTTFPFLGGTFSLGGGWLSVDAKVRGKSVRFVTAHMDPISPLARDAQAHEILAGAGADGLPLVVAGDTNSDPASAAYATFTGGGLVDTWAALHPGDPGLTCCQVPPDLIDQPVSKLYERVDYVLAGSGIEPLSESVVGADPGSRLQPSGLWPTDHAGIVATLGLDPLPATLGG